jgi:copper chaperone CopZ
MRQLVAAAVVIVAVGALQAEPRGGKQGQVKGLHLCCPSCEKAVRAILAKVEGVGDVACDRKNKTVTFSAKDQKTAVKALDALFAGGFAGTGSYGDVAFARATRVEGGKTDEVTVKGVHACCKTCIKAIQALFKDATVTVSGKGVQRDVHIAGKDLDPGDVQGKLEGAGFSGRLEVRKK